MNSSSHSSMSVTGTTSCFVLSSPNALGSTLLSKMCDLRRQRSVEHIFSSVDLGRPSPTSPYAIRMDILLFFLSIMPLRARRSKVASPSYWSRSLSLESSDVEGLRLRDAPWSDEADVDGIASFPDCKALNPYAIWVEMADISVAYKAGSTVGGCTGGDSSSIDASSAVFALVAFGTLQIKGMHQCKPQTDQHIACWPVPPPSPPTPIPGSMVAQCSITQAPSKGDKKYI